MYHYYLQPHHSFYHLQLFTSLSPSPAAERGKTAERRGHVDEKRALMFYGSAQQMVC